MIENFFLLTLILSTLLCALVTGLILGFAIVVMPGIAKFSDKEFLLAFKHMDEVIQRNQPIFMLIWVGSIISVIASIVLGKNNLSNYNFYLLCIASGLYLLGVQAPTIRFNIPLNNELQRLDISNSDESAMALFRIKFESPWNRWNVIRSLNGVVTVCMLLFLLLRI